MPLYYKIPYIFYHEWTLNIHTHTRARVLQYIYINKKLFINAKSNVTKTLSVVEYYRHLQYNNNTRKRLRKQSIEIFLFIFLVFCLYLLLFIYKKMDTLLIFPPFVVFFIINRYWSIFLSREKLMEINAHMIIYEFNLSKYTQIQNSKWNDNKHKCEQYWCLERS